MRVLVTGATGFLGSRVARHLCAQGDEVRVLVRSTSDLRRLAGLPVEITTGDVTDVVSVTEALAGLDAVVHAAAYLEFGPRDPSFMREVNVGGTETVLGAAADAGAKAVHVSSIGALGPTGGVVGDESHWNPSRSVVAYEQTKRDAHLVARRLAEAGALISIVIPGGIFGHGDQGDFDSLVRLFTYVPIPVGYLPGVVQSWVHVDDCADLIARVLDRDGEPREFVACADRDDIASVICLIVELAGRRPPSHFLSVDTVVRWLPLADQLAHLAGAGPGQVREIGTIAARDLAYSGDRARNELGWAPRSLREGMREYVHHLLIEREAFSSVGLGPEYS